MKQSGAFLARPMLILTVALVGLNLRPFMTSIGPLVSKIRAGTGLSLQGIALLTLLPMMLMGLIALLVQSYRAWLENAELFWVLC